MQAEPPDGIHISDINSHQFTIEWDPAANNCPPVSYDIAATNCGVCPNTTSHTSVRCTNLTIDGRVCIMVIQTKACRMNSEHHSGAANLTIVLSGNYKQGNVYFMHIY